VHLVADDRDGLRSVQGEPATEGAAPELGRREDLQAILL
jgi:hypothetical protein